MRNWMSGIKGAAIVVVLWIIGWGLGYGGIMEVVDSAGRIEDIWPVVLAIPGAIGGIVFSVMLLVLEGGRTFREVSLLRFAMWGGATGILLGLLTIPAGVGDVSPGAAGMTAVGAALGIISGVGTGVFFRLVGGRDRSIA